MKKKNSKRYKKLLEISKEKNVSKIDEVISILRNRWGVTYQLRLVVRGDAMFLQMMWGHLEQQSFQLNEEEFCNALGEVLDVINRLNQSSFVRKWLLTVGGKPKLGRALSLRLRADYRLQEFVL